MSNIIYYSRPSPYPFTDLPQPCNVCWINEHALSDSSFYGEELYVSTLKQEPVLRSCARNVLYTVVGYFAFQKWYLRKYSLKSTQNTEWYVLQPKVGNSTFPDIPRSNEELWKQTVDRMMVHWDLVRKGGPLSILLPIALLRLSVVVGNTTLRTMAILALLLAASSIATASILIASKEQLNSASKSDRWIDASRCPKLLSSIDFWTCLTWPITSFVWSILLSLLVIISLAVLVQLDISCIGAAKSDVAPAIIS